jgi:AraC-like DNA-binding protein/quercetin dioxygenase-like cupin family protein
MRVLPFKIPKPSNAAILFQVDQGVLYNALHHHEEIQISYIKKGTGTLVAGDTVHSFSAGEVIVLGSFQPHVFNSDTADCLMYSVFFSAASFGVTFLQLEEGKGIADFNAFAKAGFKTSITPEIDSLFQHINTAQGMHRLGHFIDLITVLKIKKSISLSTFIYERHISEKDGKRMSAIFDFTLANYRREVHLNDLASLTSMTPHSFCKYFKQRTNKSYFSFLTEVRIAHACSLLEAQQEISIADVADRCGYKTLSHFNKNFKKLMKITPSAYRDKDRT